jgi:hypothetical protein
MRTRKPELWKGIVAGAAAGLAATWVMGEFQSAWSKVQEKRKQSRTEEKQQIERQSNEGQSEDATMKTAGAVARTFGKELSMDQKKRFGPVVHYGFGALMGAVYGGLSEEFSPASTAWGTAFGSALFIVADEIAVPALGLAPGPSETPLNIHLYAWASHLVYGATLESVRRPVRSALGYDSLASRAREVAKDATTLVRKLADETKKRARSQWKSGMKSGEKSFRAMRKAA